MAVILQSVVRHCTMMVMGTNREILRLMWRVVIPFFLMMMFRFKSEIVAENLRKLHNEGLKQLVPVICYV